MKQNSNSHQPNLQKILKSNTYSSNKTVKKNIQDLEAGDFYKGTVKILRKVKPGPLILSVFDGSGTIDAIGRDSLFNQPSTNKEGLKTYDFGNIQIKDRRKQNSASDNTSNNQPLTEQDLKVDDVVEIQGKVNIHQNKIEIILESISRASVDFDAIIKSRSQPVRDTFSIPSERYESMKPLFLTIAQRIRHAIIDHQPILLRHHNDADGICAGLAVEQAIQNVMARSDISTKNLLYRSPSVTPFYDPIDLFRDISKFNRYSDQFGDRSPLVILLDTGSTPENLFALQVLHGFEYECIIIDHHNPGLLTEEKSVVCDLLQFHLNPYLFGWDNQTCGGMLCYELARFIDEDYDQPLYPAVAAIADRCKIEETELLIANTHKTREELKQMGKVIDYLSYFFKFESGDSVYDRVFTKPNLVEVIGTKVDELFDSKLQSILPTLISEEINTICYTEVDLERHSQRGKYPTPGKILGMVHDYLVEQKGSQPVFTVGHFSDGVIIRATHPVLPVPTLLNKLQRELPDANVDGGGHEQAGSLKFIAAYNPDVLQFIRREITENPEL